MLAFTARGTLAAGVHSCSWHEFVERFGTNAHRRAQMQRCCPTLQNLACAGCRCIYFVGSFVTAKPYPGDVDVCWDPAGVDETRLDPLLWDFTEGRRAQKEHLGGDFLPVNWMAAAGLTAFEFFQRDRDDEPVGIVRLDPREVQDAPE